MEQSLTAQRQASQPPAKKRRVVKKTPPVKKMPPVKKAAAAARKAPKERGPVVKKENKGKKRGLVDVLRDENNFLDVIERRTEVHDMEFDDSKLTNTPPANNKPAKDEDVPTKDEDVPAEDDTMSAEDNTMPAEDDTIPDNDDTMTDNDNTLPANDLPANNDDTPPANNDTQPAKLSVAKLKELERVEKKNTRAAAVAKKKKEKEARETAAAQKKKEKEQKKAETAQKKEAAAEAKKAAAAQPKETAKDKSSRTIGEEVALINKLFVATADSIELNMDSPKVRMALGLSQESGVSSRLSENGVGHVLQYVQRRAQDERDRREDESESEESRGEVKYVQRRLADMKQAEEEVEDTSADEESKDSNDSSFVGESFDFAEDNKTSAELTESLTEDVAFAQTQRCVHCGYRPCTFIRHEAELRETYSDLMAELSDLSDDRKHALFRLNAYSTANAWLGGAHGKGNRQRLPECMENGIRRIAPSETGYTNFRAA